MYRIPESEFKRMHDFDLREVVTKEVERIIEEEKNNAD